VVRRDLGFRAVSGEQRFGAAPVRRRGARYGLALGTITLLVTVPACSSPTSTSRVTATSTSTSTSTSPPSSVTFAQGSGAEVADCESDAKTLETALDAYMAEKGAYPSPPAAWSAATYATNFTPLTAGGGGGPFLPGPPSTNFYVIEYDASGHVWIAPPGAYGATYNPAQSFDANEDVCLAAVG
jgi:hypothetical protein